MAAGGVATVVIAATVMIVVSVVTEGIAVDLVEDLRREASACPVVLVAPVVLVRRADLVGVVDSPEVPVAPPVDFPSEVVDLREVFLAVRRGWGAVVATAVIAAVASVP